MSSAPEGAGPRVAEFFAGAGLVRLALEKAGMHVVFANDVDAHKAKIYAANFGDAGFLLRDVREIRGADVPDVDLAAASFPCTDVSVAGARRGLAGEHSGLFWQFHRVLHEMGARRPRVVMIENVVGFATSNGGKDLSDALAGLNALGYVCDVLVLDGRHFTPQSRPRLFVIGGPPEAMTGGAPRSELRPSWIADLAARHPTLKVAAMRLPHPPDGPADLAGVVDRLAPNDDAWWGVTELGRFLTALSPIQAERLETLRRGAASTWVTAYRRTREGVPMWEARADGIAGCLRTTRGGSSRQAVVEAGDGAIRVRWMSAAEYAKLQGAGEMRFAGASETQIRFALGDAVCVPAVEWLARRHVAPLLTPRAATASAAV